MLILIPIFLISCKTSTNKEYPTNNLEKNLEDNPNSEKKRMEIKFSCGEEGISEYLDDGWNILKEESQEKICVNRLIFFIFNLLKISRCLEYSLF